MLLVNKAGDYALTAISNTNTKYGVRQAVTSNNGIISLSDADVEELKVEAGSTSGTFSFKGTGDITNYLYWNSGNSLAENSTKNAKTSWTLDSYSSTNGMTIKSKQDASRIIRYNTQSNQERFACYTSSTGTLVNLYKKVYAVKYDKNGGSGSAMTDSNSPYDRNSNVTIKNNSFTPPTGKVFSTWNTKANGTGTNYAEGATISSIKKDVTLYAIWADAGCTNKVNITKGTPEGGSFNLSKTDEQNCCSELVVNVTDISATTGKRFKQITQTGLTSGVTIDQVNKTVTYAAGTSGASTINVEFETIPAHNINFYTNGGTCGTSSIPVLEGVTYSNLPTVTGLTPNCEYGTFVGWKEGNSISNPSVKPTLVTSVTMSTEEVNLYAVYSKTEGGSTPVEDELTPSSISNPSSYTAWSGKTATSDAVYAGYSTGGDNYIQLRISDNTSGIVTTTSGGNCSKVTVDWNNTTTTPRYVDVYGKNSAYTGPSDLYGENAGTLLGTLSKGDGDTELEISGNYSYIGIRSQANAIYLNSVTFTWGGGGTTTYSLDANCCTPHAITASGVGGALTLAPSLDEACVGTEITLTANSPDNSHQGTGVIKVVETTNPENDVTSTVYNASTGTLTMPNNAITITATYAEKSTPSVNADPAALDFGSPLQGASVAAQTFSLTGSALEAGTLTLVAPQGFTVDPSIIDVSAGALSAQTITVTPNTEDAGDKSGNITISGAGISPAIDLVALTMDVQATYSVNWYVNGTKIDANSVKDVEGTVVTAPTNFSAFTDCSDLHFVGWAESAIEGGSSTEAPTTVTPITAIGTTDKNYYAVFAAGTPGSTTNKFTETFAASTGTAGWSGNCSNGTISYDNTGWTADKAYGNGGSAKFGTGSARGWATTPEITVTGNATLTFKSGAWSGDKTTDGLVLSATGATLSETTFDLTDSNWDDYEVAITGATGTVQITFSAAQDSKNRFYLEDVIVSQTSASNFSMYYTTCPSCNSVSFTKAGQENGCTFELQRNSAEVSAVNTCEATSVNVVASPATGYELTNLVVSGVDGATYSAGVISIPKDKEGTLQVTATFEQTDYVVALAQSPAVGADLTGGKNDAHYGETINISTTVPSNAFFVNWTSDDVTITNPTSATGASFTMPAKDVTVTANFTEVHNVAWAIANTPSSGTLAGVYVKGIVKANPNVDTGYKKNATYYICDLDANGEPANEFYVFRGKNVGNTNFTDVNQLKEGDEVVIYGTLKTYDSTKEFDQGNYIITNGRTAASVSSVVVSGDADKTEYYASETFEYAGLSARAIYNTGYQKDVTAAATWKANTETSYTVSTSETLNVTATYGGETSDNYPVAVTVTTKTLESIEVTPAALTGYKGIALPKPTTVTAYFDDMGVASSANITALATYDEAGVYDATSTSEQTIQVKYTFGLNTRTADYTVTLSSIHNSLATAYSVEEARAIINLDQEVGNDLDLANTDNTVWVLGRVTSVETNQIIIKDDADETKILYLWKYDFGAGITSVEVGDLIKAYGNLKLYSAKYELDEGCEIVWKQPKVSIEIENQTLEIGENWTISATIVPAAAPVTYSIKNDGSDAYVSLNTLTNVITANAAGTAKIIAHADDFEEYLGNEKEFTVTVKPAAVHTNVVLYVEFGGNYYAVNNEGEATQIDVLGGKVVVANEATKNKIVWDCAEREGAATFYNTTAAKYLNGSNSTTLGVAASEGTYTNWTWTEDKYYTSNPDASTVRTFLYQGNATNFGNYAKSNAGKSTDGGYSNYATIYTGEVVVGTIETLRESATWTGEKWGTYCPRYNVTAMQGASFFKLNYMELNTDGSPYKFFFDEIGEGANLEAGKPYLFITEENVTAIKGVKYGSAAADGLHVHNGFVGYLGSGNYDLSSDNDVYTEGANNYYGLQNNIFKLIYGTSSYMINERAFIQITPTSKPATTEQPVPNYSRRRLVVGAGAPQVTTGTENIEASETPVKVMIDGQLFILRGEKMYDATGRLVK